MNIEIKRSNVNEVDDLLSIQSKAFKEDLFTYEDYLTSPATESKERLAKKIEKYFHYSIFIDGLLSGGAEVRKLSDKEAYLNRIYLLPELQSKGLGTLLMNKIESMFPEIVNWTLSTPHLNYRNHHFYEKLGYIKVGEEKVTEKLLLFNYKKIIGN